MRKRFTVVVLGTWLAILGSCLILSCYPLGSARHACCHKHAAPDTSCVHELLEKGQPAVTPAHAVPVAPVAWLPLPAQPQVAQTALAETTLPGLADLYLRNCSLLI